MIRMNTLARSISAPILGYVTIVIGALTFQEGLFGSISPESSFITLLIGGGMTTVVCVAAGYLTSSIAPFRPIWHSTPLIIWLCVEATLLHLENGTPIWFDALAGGSNAVGVALGTMLYIRQHSEHAEDHSL